MTPAIPSAAKAPATPTLGVPHRDTPSASLLYAAFFFAGLGMLMLGPILPVLSSEWHLLDGRSGMLLGAQFLGSFAGSISLGRNLRLNLMQGCLASIAGFCALAAGAALQTGFALALFAAFLCGLGLGRITTSVSLIAGARYSQRRGAALSLLNVSWGAGAFAAPLLVGALMPHLGLVRLLAIIALLGVALTLALSLPSQRMAQCDATAPASGTNTLRQGIPLALLVYFACLFLLYGGLESSISGWLSTFSMRYAGGTVRTGAYATTALWIGLAAGRVIASLIFLRVPERFVLLAGIASAGLCTAALGQARSIPQISLLALVTGLCMAPIFPAVCSRLIGTGPRPQQAGVAMAITSLGGASIPWLVGLLSQRWGSLQLALMVPVIATALLFTLAAVKPDQPAPTA